jgi:hypothetical protein
MKEIAQLWIIDRDAGICIFEQNFQPLPKEVNPDLISGFFIALISFAQELTDQDIQYIQMKAMRIYFQQAEKFVFAIASPAEIESTDNVQKVIVKLEDKFKTKYQTQIEKGYFGYTSVFESFAADVEEVVGEKATSWAIIKEKAEELKVYLDNAKSEYNNLKLFLLQRSGLVIPEGDLSFGSLVKTNVNAAKEKIGEITKSATSKFIKIIKHDHGEKAVEKKDPEKKKSDSTTEK